MGKYISVSDVASHLEISITALTTPNIDKVDEWIASAEAQLDDDTQQSWQSETVTELITPMAQINEFIVKKVPLISITKIERNDGTQWDTDWVEITNTDYRSKDASIGLVETKDYYWKEEHLKITYEAGYTTIPQRIKDLAVLYVELSYLDSRLAITSSDSTETVSVATIRIQNTSEKSIKYRQEVLKEKINELVGKVKRQVRTFNMSFPEVVGRYYTRW